MREVPRRRGRAVLQPVWRRTRIRADTGPSSRFAVYNEVMQETLRHGQATTVPARSLVVEVIEGADAGVRVSGVDVTIGTAEGSTLRLGDPTVSRYHAELRPASGGVAVVDHGSTNGTFVGAVRVDRGVVPLGTVI